MTAAVTIDAPLTWRQVAEVGEGADLRLDEAAWARVRAAHDIVRAIVGRGIRAYGVNTGVGALCDTIIGPAKQAALSRNILMSHACGVGAPLRRAETRAIIAAQVNNLAHGRSGVRAEVVAALVALLTADVLPEVPAGGSVGYLTHMAHIGLLLIGEGRACVDGAWLAGGDALARRGLVPLVLGAKEGLSLVNGTPCCSGLGALGVWRAERLLDWADAIAAMTFENLHGQPAVFGEDALSLSRSPGFGIAGGALRAWLTGSGLLGSDRTQDPLSLRAIPQVHGAARDVVLRAGLVTDQELGSVTDNPAILGTPEHPRVVSEANAVGAAVGFAMDSLGVAVAEVASMSERRIDRLVNPLVSGLPAFLAADSGAASGFMIAQYTAVSLVAENRRLAAPASLDGGITSALQEDHLTHSTPAALKCLTILDNAERILAIELLAAAQAYDLQPRDGRRAPGTETLYRAVRALVPPYADDRPLAVDMVSARDLIGRQLPRQRLVAP